MKRKEKIKVTIVLEVAVRDADEAIHVIDGALDMGGAQEVLLDALSGAGIEAKSVSALADFTY
jgi:hypothetical protein